MVKSINIETNKDFYNKVYLEGGSNGEYLKNPYQSIYFPIWKKINEILTKKEKIFEIGCGAGQLAWYLLQQEKNYYKGIDFSEVAIEKAKLLNIHNNLYGRFSVGNIYELEQQNIICDTIICCEVLEHLEKDISIFNILPANIRFIFSVPNYMSKSHVRCFKDIQEIRTRYCSYLEFVNVEEFWINKKKTNKIFLIDSIII